MSFSDQQATDFWMLFIIFSFGCVFMCIYLFTSGPKKKDKATNRFGASGLIFLMSSGLGLTGLIHYNKAWPWTILGLGISLIIVAAVWFANRVDKTDYA